MKKIMVNMGTSEKRIAVMEGERAVEFMLQRPGKQEVVGNIYKGRIVKVLPGMQAAFVDIGMEKNGYLHRNQLVEYKTSALSQVEKESKSISAYIHEGQEILVQVTKDSVGEKGPKLTQLLEIPGRFLVYMPEGGYVAMSKKIASPATRDKLRTQIMAWLEEKEGCIVRTKGATSPPEDLHTDLNQLREKWEEIESRSKVQQVPSLLYNQTDLLERLLNEVPVEDIDELVIDDYPTYMEWKKHPRIPAEKVVLHRQQESIFRSYGLEQELEKALKRWVWLKSGGHLIFDHTEAMTIIDVNTGKFTGKTNQKSTVLKTNEEAAVEIAKQLKLRNIGGIILIDFIDMRDEQDRQKVMAVFKSALKKDDTTTNIIGYTGLGLLEMTRKRTRETLVQTMTSECQTCNGTGRAMSAESFAFKAERLLWEFRGGDHEAIWLELPGAAAHLLRGDHDAHLHELEEMFRLKIVVTEKEEVRYTDDFVKHVGTVEEVKARVEKHGDTN